MSIMALDTLNKGDKIVQNSIIINHLYGFINQQEANGASKNNAGLISELKAITAQDIYLGETPSYFFAYMTCNSTGVGESSFEGAKTQRTTSLDYNTDEYLFIDGHLGAGQKGLSLFYLKGNETINFYSKNDIVKLAKRYGFQLHFQKFRDLNISMTNHRLNRYTVNVTKGPFSYPIRPIFARTAKREQLLIGYTYESNGTEYIIIEPQKEKKLKEKTGCAPWMFLGLIFPPILVAAAIVMLYNFYKDRWFN